MRINNNGDYEYCRWATKQNTSTGNIKTIEPIVWFQQGMADIRKNLLSGNTVPGCAECHQMEQFQKVSGRQKQLLKVGVGPANFLAGLKSSPWVESFQKSLENGITDLMPQDWQIDLGNYCNSACLFCTPRYSSRLAAEHKKLGLIKQMPPKAWCDDPVLLNRFLDTLRSTPQLAYLHFIGGETLITPAFKTILAALIESGLHQTTAVGFTVNLTTWDQSIVDMLIQFKEVNLGTSIECLHPVNDYVRYGGNLTETISILEKWKAVAKQHHWLFSIRTTPTILSVLHLDTIYRYAWDNQLNVESCNFLNNPAYMRPTVLPASYRKTVVDKLSSFVQCQQTDSSNQLINTRTFDGHQTQLIQDATSYINYLTDSPDESHRLPELVRYLKQVESLRKNSVLDYLPEYEELFRTAGY